MDRSRRPLPLAPLVASALLLLAGLSYLAWRPASMAGPQGAIRVVTWDVAPRAGAVVNVDAIATVLAELDADVVALQGLRAEVDSERLSEALGPGWRGEVLAGPSGGYLAVQAGPRMEVLAYHLIPTGAGDALAVTLRHESGRTCRVVCLNAASGVGDATARARHLDGIWTWCTTRPSALTLLAGATDVDAETASRLDGRFVQVGSGDGRPPELRVMPGTTRISQAARVAHPDAPGAAASPLLVDVALR